MSMKSSFYGARQHLLLLTPTLRHNYYGYGNLSVDITSSNGNDVGTALRNDGGMDRGGPARSGV